MDTKKHRLNPIIALLLILTGSITLTGCLKSNDDNFDEIQENFQNYLNDRWKVTLSEDFESSELETQWYILFNKNANDYKYTFSEEPISTQYDLIQKAMSIYDPYNRMFYINTQPLAGDQMIQQAQYSIQYSDNEIKLTELNYMDGYLGRTFILTRDKIDNPFVLQDKWIDHKTGKNYHFNSNNELIITLADSNEQNIKGYKWKKETAVLELFDSPTITPESPVVDYFIAKHWTENEVLFQAHDSQFTLTKTTN